MRNFLVIYILIFASISLQAQIVSNIVPEATQDGKVSISYNLKDSLSSKYYVVKIYSSIDNFQTPLNYVTGDVGDSVILGNNSTKTIIWDMALAYPTFDAEVNFEIRAKHNVPLTFTTVFSRNYNIKKKLHVEYKGYNHSNQSYFLLTSKSDTVKLYPSPSMDNRTDIVFPHKLKKQNYQLNLINPLDNQKAISSSFVVKRNRHLVIKIAVPLLIGGLVGYILTIPKATPNSNNTTTPVVDDSLPEMPLPQ